VQLLSSDKPIQIWERLTAFARQALAATTAPAVVPDSKVHQTVARNWLNELEHNNAVLRHALERLIKEKDFGIYTGSTALMLIRDALEETSAVAVVPASDVEPLLDTLDELASVCSCDRPEIVHSAGSVRIPGPHTGHCVDAHA